MCVSFAMVVYSLFVCTLRALALILVNFFFFYFGQVLILAEFGS